MVGRTAKRLLPALALLAAVAYLVQRYLVHPNPAHLLERTVERYGSLESYSDTTTVKSDLATVRGAYQFAYGRPNRLRVQFQGLLDDELVVSDGVTLYVYRPTTNEYRATPAPRELPEELPGAQPMLKLSLLNGNLPLHRVGRARYLGRRKVDGQWVHRVSVTGVERLTGERAPSMTQGSAVGEALDSPSGEQPAGTVPASLVLWIGAQDALIHRIDMTFRIGSQTVTNSLRCEGIATQAAPDGAFTFRPPPGARPVASFRAPQVEPAEDEHQR